MIHTNTAKPRVVEELAAFIQRHRFKELVITDHNPDVVWVVKRPKDNEKILALCYGLPELDDDKFNHGLAYQFCYEIRTRLNRMNGRQKSFGKERVTFKTSFWMDFEPSGAITLMFTIVVESHCSQSETYMQEFYYRPPQEIHDKEEKEKFPHGYFGVENYYTPKGYEYQQVPAQKQATAIRLFWKILRQRITSSSARHRRFEVIEKKVANYI